MRVCDSESVRKRERETKAERGRVQVRIEIRLTAKSVNSKFRKAKS